jgi:carbamoyl-phosphate synthase large subunit
MEVKVLFTNAGRRTYLVEFAIQMLCKGYPMEIHVSDCTPFNASMHINPIVKTHILPPVLESPERYIKELIDLVTRFQINVLFPLSDLDPLLISENQALFAKHGCKVIVSSPETILRCNDKVKTFSFCREMNLPTPEIYLVAEQYKGPYPVFQKPIFGSGSHRIKNIHSSKDLADFILGHDMLQPLIDGEEFGLDILNDLDGNFLAVCVKHKLLMRAGETDKAQIVRDHELEALGHRISNAFRHIGNLDCDVLRAADGKLYCIDFNPRFGGGYPATHLAGFNYFEAILDMIRGFVPRLPISPRSIIVMKGISLTWCDTP